MADRIVAFAGSLRRGSYNAALIHAARELTPGGMTIEPIEIGELPFYNADVEVYLNLESPQYAIPTSRPIVPNCPSAASIAWATSARETVTPPRRFRPIAVR